MWRQSRRQFSSRNRKAAYRFKRPDPPLGAAGRDLTHAPNWGGAHAQHDSYQKLGLLRPVLVHPNRRNFHVTEGRRRAAPYRVDDYLAASRCARKCFLRRHQPSRPPLARIRPGSPAPATGPGTATSEMSSKRVSETREAAMAAFAKSWRRE
jgi:hypothetical protein